MLNSTGFRLFVNPRAARAAPYAAGGRAFAVETDVANPSSVESLVSAVNAEFGRIDILVNNAAIFSTLEMRPFEEIPLSEWEAVLRVNVTGPYLCARGVLPTMRSESILPSCLLRTSSWASCCRSK